MATPEDPPLEAANDDRTPPLEISDSDLRAYAEGRLSGPRRRQVEGFLACNPDLAARMMAGLHMRGDPVGEARPRRGAGWRAGLTAQGVAGCLGSGILGWTAAGERELDGWREADGDHPPEYVEDAAESRLAMGVRGQMVSQLETPRLDEAEVARLLKVKTPRLPGDWRLLDAQVFPTDHGPGLNLLLETPGQERLILFAVKARTLTGGRPELAVRGREAAVFWERGRSAYVLSGDLPHGELLARAETLRQVEAL